MPVRETRSEELDLRLSPAAKRSLQYAVREAKDTLAERRRFGLNAEEWEAFQAALHAPPRPTPGLAKLLREPSVIERGELE